MLQVTWKFYDRTMSRFDNSLTGYSEFRHGLPTPGYPNVLFSDEVHCESPDMWQYNVPVPDSCYAVIQHGRPRKRPPSPDTAGNKKKAPIQTFMKNYFLLQGTSPVQEASPTPPYSTTEPSTPVSFYSKLKKFKTLKRVFHLCLKFFR